jgi:phosphoenolpyruvate carboxykinase (ATP)
MSLRHTRAIIDAIHSGELSRAETVALPLFGLQVRALTLEIPRASWEPPLGDWACGASL